MNSNNKYFKKNVRLPIDDFFEDVLYNKNYGYYAKKNPFEKNGDFITSPSISFLFGEMLAVWIVYFWESLGKPKKFNIVELGPGNGKLSKHLLKTFKFFPEFKSSLNFFLLEKSSLLKNIQKKSLEDYKVKWISNLKVLKKGPVLFFGNEFFDAIPIKQFKINSGKMLENYVSLDNSNKIKEILLKASLKDFNKIKSYKALGDLKFIEYPKKGIDILDPILNKIKELNGGLLLIDYGYVKKNNLNTLQSVKKHKKNKLFNSLGNSDITSLVNFNLLREHFLKNKLFVENVVTQSFFLKKIGILERANQLSLKMNFREKSDLYIRIKRLIDYDHMGKLFKVIFASKTENKDIVGFN
jgi:NADH dehydrogenase [ubiquinone] 1 alpha subcomplex assembly factor 7